MKKILKDKRLYLFSLLGLLLFFIYFSFLPIITPDSTVYYEYIEILKGNIPLSSWHPTRGPSMPIVIYLITTIFGDNVYGFLIGTFIFYLVFLLFAYKIIKEITKIYIDKITNWFLWFMYILLIVFNPLIIGYFHPMLTEFVAMTISLIACFMSYKWIEKNYHDNYLSFLIYVIIFILLTVFMWFLKQPYVSVVIFPLFISTILSIFKMRNIRNTICKISVFVVAIIFLIISIVVWNKILIYNGANSPSNKTTNFLTSGLINGLSNFREISNDKTNDILFIENNEFLTEMEKKELVDIINNKSKYKNFKLFNVFNTKSDKIIDVFIIYQTNIDSISLKEASSYIFNSFFEYPILVLDSYFSNYLATIDVYISYTSDWVYYYPIKTFEDSYNENKSIGLAIYDDRNIYWWAWSDGTIRIDNMVQYEKINNPNDIAVSMMSLTKNLNLTLFKIVFLIAPIAFVFFSIKYIRNFSKKEYKLSKLYEILIILFGFSFLHVLMHAVTGAIIDRYASVAYPSALLATMLMIKLIRHKKEVKIDTETINKNGKLLFVIPAYNEEQNIIKVLDEIKNDIPKADIIVINDCSNDGTVSILGEKGANYLSMPFNVGYAMAVQTGLKYAYYNNYDYVIQFDADGQHIAKEAKKLLEKMKEDNCDIVIGSRFLNKDDYHHSFFRKIGTKLFASLIMIICNQKITDPTSGFQCLNRRVLERYSKMGGYPEFPDANLIIEMLMDGYKISEIGVKMRQREFGESMHGGLIKPIKYIIKVFYVIMIILIRNIKFERNR